MFASNQVKPGLPAALKFRAPELLKDNDTIVGADDLKISIGLSSLLSTQKLFSINGALYDGTLKGVSHVSFSDARFNLDMSFNGIQIGQIPGVVQLMPHKMTGVAGGHVSFNNEQSASGKGATEFTLTQLGFNFSPSLFGIDKLLFNTIDVNLGLNNQRIDLKRVDIKSNDLTGNVSGYVIIRQPVQLSQLNITGSVSPKPSFIRQLKQIIPEGFISEQKLRNGNIGFRISGTFDNPSYSLK